MYLRIYLLLCLTILINSWNPMETLFEPCLPDFAAFPESLSESPPISTSSPLLSPPPLLPPLSLGQLLIKGRVGFSEAQCFGCAGGNFLFGTKHEMENYPKTILIEKFYQINSYVPMFKNNCSFTEGQFTKNRLTCDSWSISGQHP